MKCPVCAKEVPMTPAGLRIHLNPSMEPCEGSCTPGPPEPPKVKPDKERRTRDLLGELKTLRARPEKPDWDNCADVEWDVEQKQRHDNRIAELKSILDTREHVDRIDEGKQKRRNAAAKNRGNGKSKDR